MRQRAAIPRPALLPTPSRCRRLREAAGLSGAALAAHIGVSPASVYGWETERSEPTGLQREVYSTALRQLAAQTGLDFEESG